MNYLRTSRAPTQDYLQKFEEFVKENSGQIEALEILLNQPQDFDTGQLKALRAALATNPDSLADKFTEKNLRRAYNKELADIISIYGMRPLAASCSRQSGGSTRA